MMKCLPASWFSRAVLAWGLAFAAAAPTLRADEVKLGWQSAKAMEKAGYYMPMQMRLSGVKPAELKGEPAGLQAPLYGKLTLGPAEAPTTFQVVIDEPEGSPARLFVDTNGSGDLTGAQPAEWKAQTSGQGAQYTTCFGGADFAVAYGAETLKLHVSMYRFDKRDPQRAALTNVLFYYRDFARSGQIVLGGKTYQAMLVDDQCTGDFRPGTNAAKSGITLLIDLNNDGKFQSREKFSVTKPFNIGGTTYEIAGLSASGGSFQVVPSSQTVPETKPSPDLSSGKPAPAFEAKTLDQNTVLFPQTYKGKLVLLDFWATWCAPCRGELPFLTSAYERFHSQGFEVLGVSLDQTNQAAALAKFTQENKMPWPEIYDGLGWKAAVAQQYDIESIPHPFLVDGDTGKIVAEGDALRGDSLAGNIEKALPKRR